MKKKILKIVLPISILLIGAIVALCVILFQNKNPYELKTENFEATIEFNGDVDLNTLSIYNTKTKTNITASEFTVVSCSETNSIGEKILVIEYNGIEFTIPFKVKYKVEFYLDDQVVSSQFVTTAEEIIIPENITKTGYEFISWDTTIPESLDNNLALNAIMSSTTLTVPKLQTVATTYGTKLSEISLPNNINGHWEFTEDNSTYVGNVGTHTFNVKFVPSTNELVERYSTIDIVVEQKELTFTILQDEFTYNGLPQFPIYSLPVSGLNVTESDHLINASNNSYDYYIIINEPNYRGSCLGTFKINKANVNLEIGTEFENNQVDYNQEFNLTYTITGFENEQLLGLTFDNHINLNAGTHYIGATSNNPNINLIVEKAIIEVLPISLNPAPANPTLSTAEVPAVYGDTLSTITFKDNFANGKWEWVNANSIIDKITGFKATAKFTPYSNNFKAETREIAVDNISKKTLSIKVTDNEFTYNGEAKTIAYNIENGIFNNLNVVGNVEKTNAGTYVTTLSIEEEFYQGSVDTKLIINKATPVTNFTTTYTKTWFTGIKLSNIELSSGYTWASPSTSIDVGTQSYLATFTPADTDNYNSVEGNFEVTINKASATITNVLDKYTFVYTGNPHTISGVQPLHNEENLQYAYSKNGAPCETLTNAGTYDVTITLPESAHYNRAQATATVVIEKADLNVQLSSLTATYEDTLSVVKLPEVNNGVWYWKENSTTPVGDAGEQKHFAVFTPNNENYNFVEFETTILVAPKNLTIEITTNKFTYNGENHKLIYIIKDNNQKDYSGLEIIGNTEQVNASTYDLTLSVKNPNYKATKTAQLIIEKATPIPTLPTNLTATYLDLVQDVNLPTAENGTWKWNTTDSTSVGNAGSNSFSATFTFKEEDGCDNFFDYTTDLTINVAKKVVVAPTLKSTSETYTGNKITAQLNNDTNSHLYNVTENGWTNVNDYNVKLTLSDADNYKWQTSDLATINIPFRITKAQAVISDLNIIGWEFNQPANGPTASSNFGTVAYTYSTEEFGTYTSTIPTNAGSYFVKATVANDNNYDGCSSVKSFNITKAFLTAPTILPKPYTGSLQKADVTPSPLYSIENNGGTEKGSYDVILTITNSNYQWRNETNVLRLTFSITSVVNSWSVEKITMPNWTYGETPEIETITATYSPITVQYKLTTQGDEHYTTTLPTNAGCYVAKYYASGSESYNSLTEYVYFTIFKKGIDVPQNISTPYTGNEITAEFDASTIYYIDTENSTLSATNVSTNTIKFVISNSNYKWNTGNETVATITFKITQATTTISNLSIENWTFNETAKNPTASSNFGTLTYKYSTEQEGTYSSTVPTNAGTYYVKAFIAGTTNYSSAESKPFEFTISKKDVVVPTLASATSTYTGSTIYAQIINNQTDLYNVSENGWTNVGNYNVKLTLNNPNNYKWNNSNSSTLEILFSIKKAQAVISDLDIVGWEFNKPANDPTASSNFGTIAYTYSTEEFGTYTSTVPTNAGSYFVKATIADDNNYDGCSSVTSFNITKAFLTAPIILPKPYTGSLQKADVTPSPLYSIENNGGTEKGSYDVILTITNSNYQWGNGTNVLKIPFTITEVVNSWSSTPTIPNWTYGETPKIKTITATYSPVTVQYKLTTQSDEHYTTTLPTNAGSYVAKYYASGSESYNELTEYVFFTIAKKDVVVPTLTNNTAIYTGSTISAQIENPETDLYNITENGWTNIGNYNVKLTLKDADNYKWENRNSESVLLPFSITQATTVISKVTIGNWTYNGIAAVPTDSTPNATTNFGNIVFKYSNALNGTYSTTVPTNAGTYYVKGFVTSTTPNYTSATSEATSFTIYKEDVVVPTLTTNSAVYTGSIIYAQLENSKTELYNITNGWTEVGNHNVELTLINPTNYKWTNSDLTTIFIPFSITQATTVVSNVTIGNWTFGETASSPYATTNFGTISYMYSNTVDGTYSSNVPTNAGTYFVKAVITGNNNYTSAESAEPTQFTISIATTTISNLKIGNWTYNGIAEVPSNCTPTATKNFGTISYVYSNTIDGTYSTTVPTDAGTYYVKAVITGTNNYTSATSEPVSFTIAKKDVVVPTLASATAIYTGSTISAQIENHETDLYNITENGWTNVGNYNVTLTLKDADNYKWENRNSEPVLLPFSITQATTVISKVTIGNWTYNGIAAVPTDSTPNATTNFGNIVFKYSNALNGTYSTTVPTNAGTYYVKAVITGTNNYTSATSEPISFTIAKKDVVVPTLTNNTAIYTGSTISAQLVTPETSLYNITENGWTNVGNYNVTLTLIDSNNYKWTTSDLATINVPFSITQATTVVSNVTIGNWTYNGIAEVPADKAPTATTNFGKINFVYSNEENGTYSSTVPTDAGTYYVKAVVNSTTNNYTSAESTPVEFTIEKFGIDKPSDISTTYTGSEITAEFEESEIYYIDTDHSILKATNVSENIVTFVISNPNYKWNTGDETTATAKFSITKATISISGLSIQGWTFGDEKTTPSATAYLGTKPITLDKALTFKYSTEPSGTYNETIPENVGTYFVKAFAEEGQNYHEATSSALSFSILKANASISSLSIDNWTYLKDSAPNYSITRSNYVNPADIVVEYLSNSAWSTTKPSVPGTYQIRAKINGIPNYNGCDYFTGNTFEISQPNIKLTATNNPNGDFYLYVDDVSTIISKSAIIEGTTRNIAVEGKWDYKINDYTQGTEATCTITFTPNDIHLLQDNPLTTTVTFTVKSVAKIASTQFATIESALSAAKSGDIIYVPADNTGKVQITKDCEIKSGVTLSFLYGTAESTCLSESAAPLSGADKGDYSKATKTSEILVKNGIILTNYGTIAVAGQLSGGNGGTAYAGHTAGQYVEILMDSNSKINSTGKILINGYINEKSLNNKSLIDVTGGEISLPFILHDYHGGSYMYATYYGEKSGWSRVSKEVSPFIQYQFRNISSKLKVSNTGSIYAYANLTAASAVRYSKSALAGSGDDFMIQFNTGAYLEAKYNPTTDVCDLDFFGGFTLNSLKIKIKIGLTSLSTINVDSSTVYFPLNCYFDISLNAAENTTNSYNLKQKLKMMPGSKLTINQGVTATFSNINIYNSSFVDDIADNLGTKYPTKKDAELIVNGTMICDNIGGKISSEKTGATVQINTDSYKLTTYETTGGTNGSSTSATINFKPIELTASFIHQDKNATPLVPTGKGVYTYSNGVWSGPTAITS